MLSSLFKLSKSTLAGHCCQEFLLRPPLNEKPWNGMEYNGATQKSAAAADLLIPVAVEAVVQEVEDGGPSILVAERGFSLFTSLKE